MATEATRERPQTGSPGGVLSSHARERPTRLHSRAVTTVDPKLLLNRELSWLEFNQRVLDEAADPGVPLLERVKFLAIVATNLDEFFMIRVAGLKQQAAGGDIVDPPGDGLTPQEQLAQIAPRVHRMVRDLYAIWREQVCPALAAAAITIAAPDTWSADALALHGASTSPARSSPSSRPSRSTQDTRFLASRTSPSTSRCPSDESHRDESGEGFAVVQVPAITQRLVDVGGAASARTFVLLEDIIARNVGQLFAGVKIRSVAPFRVTRNWDLEIDEEEAEDLLEAIQQELPQARPRQRRPPGGRRLDGRPLPRALRGGAPPRPAGRVRRRRPPPPRRPHGHRAAPGRAPRAPRRSACDLAGRPPLRDVEDPFALLADRDVLLQHPYESFESVVEFVQRAADDPKVLAIKMTLYRAGRDSPFVRALARAADNGKQVTALVELKARFDEEANIQWARALEESGVHVVYGVLGLKTHAKVCLVVRRDASGLRRYVHMATGNYNPGTARLYTDLSLFSARPELADDVTAFFNLLTGYCEPPQWKRLAVAPLGLRAFVLQLIAREADHARAGRPARVVAKMNALVDPDVIDALYDASQAGVAIDLIVRGICCLRPGVPGVSERIRVVSIVDRFLEHARVVAVENGGAREVYLSSADWMPRNFDRRVEVIFPVEAQPMARWILDDVLGVQLSDTAKASVLKPDGTYERRRPAEGEAPYRSQARFIESARDRARQSMMPGPQFRMRPPEAQPSLALEHPTPRMVTRRRKKRAEST